MGLLGTVEPGRVGESRGAKPEIHLPKAEGERRARRDPMLRERESLAAAWGLGCLLLGKPAKKAVSH